MKQPPEDQQTDLASLLPMYLSGRLSPEQHQRVSAWLEYDAQGREELRNWQRIRSAMQDRVPPHPPAGLWLRLQQRIEMAEQRRKRSPASIAAGFILSVLTLILLWLTIRPGVMLEWTVDGGSLAVYRVYRAQAGSQEFVLLGEIPAEPGENRYAFLDALFLPGQRYIYQVEGISTSGEQVVSQSVASQPLAALPGQLAILLTSGILGYLAASTVSRWKPGGYGGLRPA